jgi:hypothetical protein
MAWKDVDCQEKLCTATASASRFASLDRTHSPRLAHSRTHTHSHTLSLTHSHTHTHSHLTHNAHTTPLHATAPLPTCHFSTRDGLTLTAVEASSCAVHFVFFVVFGKFAFAFVENVTPWRLISFELTSSLTLFCVFSEKKSSRS